MMWSVMQSSQSWCMGVMTSTLTSSDHLISQISLREHLLSGATLIE